MRPPRSLTWRVALAAVLLALPAFAAAGREALLVELSGAIGPASAAFVDDGLDRAERHGAEVLVLRIDTPGGLDSSMRAIVKSILASRVPVIGYVAPSGARAASAGTYILYASHVAAMAPGTNLGAATPVQIGGLGGGGESPAASGDGKAPQDAASSRDAMTQKLVNDATAYLTSLAELRGRDAEWAARAVREGASLSAESALKLEVIDLIAPDLADLLAQANGRTVRTSAGPRTLVTDGLAVVEQEPGWMTRVLAILSDPNVAYILLLIGVYGLVFEFSNPGTMLPGTVGVICLVLALYAFQLLPVSWAGLALIGLGLGMMIAEAFVPSFGALGLGGASAFVIGSLILIDSDTPGFAISIPLIAAFALSSALFLLLVVRLAVKAYRRPVATGGEELIGARGMAMSGFPGPGSVHLRGEVWSARSTRPIPRGTPIRVVSRDGLILSVEPLSDSTE
jgi:membrane-bound serine protease (ClpP class)